MALEAISPVGAEQALRAVDPAALAPANASSGDFGAWFAREVGSVNQGLLQAQSNVQAVAMGQGGNLHQVMIQLEEAKLSFQLLAQVRNRVLEAYQEVMRTQV